MDLKQFTKTTHKSELKNIVLEKFLLLFLSLSACSHSVLPVFFFALKTTLLLRCKGMIFHL